MGWIKRNLLFVVIGVVALGALGAAGYYIYTSWDANSAASTALDENYDKLNTLIQQKPSPGDDKVDNTKIALEQEKQLREWIGGASASFQPVAPVPSSAPTIATFLGALQKTAEQLQHVADGAGVTLPPKYEFSFTAEKDNFNINATYLPQLAQQLGEVKTIAEVLFSARVNNLDRIQRVRVTEQDATAQEDYLDVRPITNNLAIITPYVVSFRCFTPELSRVISGFAKSSSGFIVKAVNVQPASASSAPGAEGMMPGAMPGGYPGMMPGAMPGGYAPGVMPGAAVQPAQAAAAKGGLQTVLKEQLLRVTLEVDLVKLQPKS
jgi:hypothetical protein